MMPIDLVIMAGGEGTRLRPLTDAIPKALLAIPYGDTILDNIISFFKNSDLNIRNIFVLTKYKSDLIFSYIKVKYGEKSNIRVIVEDDYLGTIGGLSLIENELSDNFFVSNCDILAQFKLRLILDSHIAQNKILSIMAFDKKIFVPYGVFTFDEKGDVLDFLEKPEMKIFANSGIYLMNKKIFDFFHSGKMDMNELIYEILVQDKEKLAAFPLDVDSFQDIGEWDSYKKILGKI